MSGATASHGFQSTHPVWGATQDWVTMQINCQISIHAPRVGCDQYILVLLVAGQISIHAPRVGCDKLEEELYGKPNLISIHAPRVGCDEVFQMLKSRLRCISIHAPRVGCDLHMSICCSIDRISIHAPRVGCDWDTSTSTHRILSNFNPRTPCGVRHIAPARKEW